MKKTTTKKNAKQIANEAWYMLPNDCKVIMKDLKKSFMFDWERTARSIGCLTQTIWKNVKK